MTYDSGTEDLLTSVADGVLTLTLNRPAARNALSRGMLDGLARLLGEAEADPAIGAIVITGAGGAFCAGGDVKGMAARNENGEPEPIDAAIARQRRNQRETAGRLHAMPKPTIAAIPGAAAGAGLSMALACDLRVMASAMDRPAPAAAPGMAAMVGLGMACSRPAVSRWLRR